MQKIRIDRKVWIGIIIAQLLFLGIAGVLFDRRETVSLQYAQEEISYSSGESGAYVDATTDSRYVATPKFILPKGMYTLDVKYDHQGDAKLNIVYVDEQYDSNVSGDIAAENYSGSTFTFRVKYADRPMQIRGSLGDEAVEGDYLLIRSVAVTTSDFALKNVLFWIALCFLVLDGLLLLYSGKGRWSVREETKNHAKFLLLLLFVQSIPLMVNYLTYGHDLRFHLMRIEGLSAGLMEGIFPVRIQPEWLDGHGYAASVFYGDLFLYLPAVLHIFGVTVQAAYKCYVVLVNVATVCISYHCFSKMSDRNTGLLCTTVYSLNIYRLVCIYTRTAVGEYTAMVFLPLVAYGLWKIYTLPEESKEHGRSFITLAAGCSGIFMSHMISTEMTAFFIVLICVLLWRKTFRKKTFLVLIKSAVMAALLCLWFLVPFLDYMLNGEYKVNAANSFPVYLVENRGTFVAQFFMNVYDSVSSSGMIVDGATRKMPKTIGCASMAVLAGWIFFCLFRKERDKKEKKEEYFAVFLLCFALYMATYLVPYTLIAKRIPVLQTAIKSIQFPWRFLSIAGIAAVYLLCLLMRKNWIEKKKKTIFAVLLLCLSFCQSYSYVSSFLNESTQEGNVSGFSIIGGEYMPKSYNIGHYKNKLTYHEDTIAVADWHRIKGGVELSLTSHADETEQVEVPLLLYRGYQAVTETGETLAIQAGKSSRISVSVPSGFAGTIRVAFREPWYWRVCEVISFLAAVGLLYLLAIPRSMITTPRG
ncbi:MAG: hypothetical protein NC302_03540 [Bacteroidales bacterium]|nr:hypothetical protein [Bacteroidales bacterium]MCM1416590.1 hypothetical protein [bacterium]MCM1422858.1 hypothetical protein [bacterium]